MSLKFKLCTAETSFFIQNNAACFHATVHKSNDSLEKKIEIIQTS